MSNTQCDNGINKNTTSKVISFIYKFVLFSFIIFIILVILLLALISFMRPEGHARIDTTKASIKVLKSAVITFQMNTGRLPTEEEGLNALVKEPEDVTGWNPEGYLMTDTVPLDGWKHEFIYKLNPQSPNGFTIISLGKGGKEGGEGEKMDLSSDDIN